VRYDLKLVHELCGELGLRSQVIPGDSVEVDLGGEAVLCFINSEHEKDCLVGFKDTPWHFHDGLCFADARGHVTELNYLDVLTALKEGKVLVCEQRKSGSLTDRSLVHSEFNDELRYMQDGDELRIWRAPR
jgi:hypothetical protein